MRKALLVLSGALWVGALTFAPAPASAGNGFWAKYPTEVDYFSCSTYESISEYTCADPDSGLSVTFYGRMKNTIPLSACAGSCNGTQNLHVVFNPGNGRKINDPLMGGQCMGGFLLYLTPCSTCS